MKHFLTSGLIICCISMSGCHTAKQTAPSPPVVLANSDSVRTEYVETLRIDTVTVEFQVPMESFSQIVRDTASRLETSLAISDAWINPDGSLGHSIRNKPESLKSDIHVAVKDSRSNNSAIKTTEIPIPYPVEKVVEKDLSAWQKFRLNAFWILVLCISCFGLYKLRRYIFKYPP